MRSPRRSERIPAGGRRLYELLRLDHEPVFISIFLVEEVAADRPETEDTLLYSMEFDPMQYFWPVEGQHCIVELKREMSKESRARLMKALQRDNAVWVTIITPAEGFPHIEHWGDTDGFMRSRYGDARADSALGSLGPPA